MGGDRSGVVRKDVVRLFEGDSVAALGEGELLRRFASRRDEVAFEALVGRLGPMVLGIARRMLADPHDVEDAFQATFLVLVRKAVSIRDPDLVAPWLYGVALKVARRARVEAGRRKTRERLAVVPEAVEAETESGSPELRTLIDEEIGRLPEDHRRAVVLCDVEGLSREEAAVRLGWTLNMVRGRLERARGRLRGRLARRGLAPSGAGMGLLITPPTLSPTLLASTVRAALAFSTGRLATGLASASAVALSQGVLRMMLLSKLKLGAVALLSTAFVAGGSGWIAAQAPGEKPAVDPSPFTVQVQQIGPTYDLASLGKSRVEAARKRWETQRAFYNEGRITVDRLLAASQTLMDAELDTLDRPEGRFNPIWAHLERIQEIERRERAELAAGRGTQADVEEVQTQALEAQFQLAKEMQATASRLKNAELGPAVKAVEHVYQYAVGDPLELATLGKSRIDAARKLWEVQQDLFTNARTELDRPLNASRMLMQAELDATEAPLARMMAIKDYIERLKVVEDVARARKEASRASQAAVDEVQTVRLEAVFQLTKEAEQAAQRLRGGTQPPAASPAPASTADLERRLSDLEKKVDRLIYLIDAPKR